MSPLSQSSDGECLPARRMGGEGRHDPIVVLIHGMWSRPAIWDNFRGFLEERGYRVVVPTLRHHDTPQGSDGDPSVGRMSLRDYAHDLETQIRALPEKPFVIGHSMGGLLAQMLAARKLLSGACLLASVPCAPILPFHPSVIRIFLRALMTTQFWRRPQLPSYKEMRRAALNGLSKKEAETLYASLLPDSGRVLVEVAFWYLHRNPAAFIDTHDIDCPLLFVAGDKDGITPLTIVRRNALYHGAKARLDILPGRSHWLPAEQGWQNLAARCARFFEEAQGRSQMPQLQEAVNPREVLLPA